MKVPCLLPWINVHIDACGRVLPCAPETTRISFGHLAAEGASTAWHGIEAENSRHCMVSRQWPKICRKSCPVLQAAPIDLLLGAPPRGHPGLGSLALDAASWNQLRQSVMQDPDHAPPAPLTLTIEEGEQPLDRTDLAFDRLQELRLVLHEQRPLGPTLGRLLETIRKEAPQPLAIVIEASLASYDAETRRCCEQLAPRRLALVTRGLAGAALAGDARAAASNLRVASSAKLAPRTALVLEITRAAIAGIAGFFDLARDHRLQAMLRRPRGLLGSEDPFALRAYRELKQLAEILERCRSTHADVWQAADRARWEREPLLARITRPDQAAYFVVAHEPIAREREQQVASRRGA